MAVANALAPVDGASDEVPANPPRSGGLVIKNIFNRSKGAVAVLDTENPNQGESKAFQLFKLPAPATPPAKRYLAVGPKSHEGASSSSNS